MKVAYKISDILRERHKYYLAESGRDCGKCWFGCPSLGICEADAKALGDFSKICKRDDVYFEPIEMRFLDDYED